MPSLQAVVYPCDHAAPGMSVILHALEWLVDLKGKIRNYRAANSGIVLHLTCGIGDFCRFFPQVVELLLVSEASDVIWCYVTLPQI